MNPFSQHTERLAALLAQALQELQRCERLQEAWASVDSEAADACQFNACVLVACGCILETMQRGGDLLADLAGLIGLMAILNAELAEDSPGCNHRVAEYPAREEQGQWQEFHLAHQPDRRSMNQKRAAWAEAGLSSFRAITGQESEEETAEAIADFICDVLHLAKSKGCNPLALVTQGIEHYEYEVLHPDE